MTEINQCTKAGQLHESLSGQNQDSTSSSAKPSIEFVKASQLIGKNSSAGSSGRNNSLHLFAPASKHFTTVNASSSDTVGPFTVVGGDINSFKEASRNLPDSRIGFRLASELLPGHNSDPDVEATCEREAVKLDSTPVSTVGTSAPQLVPPDSTSEANSIVIDLTSVKESKPDTMKRAAPKAKASTSRKRKSDPAIAKTKKITYFFEK